MSTKYVYETTYNEDGSFSVALPDGDELRIIPPRREWVEISDEEGAEIWADCHDIDWERVDWKRTVSPKEIVKRISDKLKDKNT